MMLPFQQIPIVLPGNPADGEQDKEVHARIQPSEIESYNDGYHWGCLIKFKSGEILMTPLTAVEVENLIGHYWQRATELIKRMQASPTILPIQ